MLIKSQKYHLTDKISDLTDVQIIFLSILENVYKDILDRENPNPN